MSLNFCTGVVAQTTSNEPARTPSISVYQARMEVIIDDGFERTKLPAITSQGNAAKELEPGEYRFINVKGCQKDDRKNCLINSKGFVYPSKADQVKDLSWWGNPVKVLYAPMYFGKVLPDGSIKKYGVDEPEPAFHSDISICNSAARAWYIDEDNPVNYFADWDLNTLSVNPNGGQICHPPKLEIVQERKSFGCVRLGFKDLARLYNFVFRQFAAKRSPPIYVYP